MIQLPQKKYNIIYADPPWSYSDKGCNGNADEHYQTMTITDICKCLYQILRIKTAFYSCGQPTQC